MRFILRITGWIIRRRRFVCWSCKRVHWTSRKFGTRVECSCGRTFRYVRFTGRKIGKGRPIYYDGKRTN